MIIGIIFDALMQLLYELLVHPTRQSHDGICALTVIDDVDREYLMIV